MSKPAALLGALCLLLVSLAGAPGAKADEPAPAPPALPTLTLSADAPSVLEGGALTVTAVLKAPDGTPVDAFVRISGAAPADGSPPVSTAGSTAAGVFTWRLEPVTRSDVLTATAELFDGRTTAPATLTFTVTSTVALTATAPRQVTPYAAVFARVTGSGRADIYEPASPLILQRRRVPSTSWESYRTLSRGGLDADPQVTALRPATRIALWAPTSGVWEFRIERPATAQVGGSLSGSVRLRIAGAPPAWLVTLNRLRRASGSGPAYWDVAGDRDAALHARWMARNNTICHCETKGTPGYSAKGDAVGARSWLTLGGSSDRVVTDPANGVRGLTAAPFHSLGMMSRTLVGVSFATARYGSAASVVIYGVDTADIYSDPGLQTAPRQPLTYPGAGATVPAAFRLSPNESPDPHAPCGRAYAPNRSGAPVWASWGVRSGGDSAPAPVSLVAATLTSGGKKLAVCAYDGAHAKSRGGALMASVLQEYQAVVIVPRAPLLPGRRYTASVRTNLGTRTWSFAVGR